MFWGLYNQLVETYSEKEDYHSLHLVYGQMALFLTKGEEGSFKEMLTQSHRMELLRHQQEGHVKKVIINNKYDQYVCNACRMRNQQSFTLEEALAQNPLPCEGCTRVMDKAEGYCRCSYSAVVNS